MLCQNNALACKHGKGERDSHWWAFTSKGKDTSFQYCSFVPVKPQFLHQVLGSPQVDIGCLRMVPATRRARTGRRRQSGQRKTLLVTDATRCFQSRTLGGVLRAFVQWPTFRPEVTVRVANRLSYTGILLCCCLFGRLRRSASTKVYFCSRDCQQKAWPIHKQACQLPAECQLDLDLPFILHWSRITTAMVGMCIMLCTASGVIMRVSQKVKQMSACNSCCSLCTALTPAGSPSHELLLLSIAARG